MAIDHAAEHGAEHRAEDEDDGGDGDVGAPLARGNHLRVHDGHHGVDARGAHALEGTEDDPVVAHGQPRLHIRSWTSPESRLQLQQGRDGSANDGKDGKQANRQKQHGLPSQYIAELGVDDQETGVGEKVRGHDPVALVEAAQRVSDGDERSADDGCLQCG